MGLLSSIGFSSVLKVAGKGIGKLGKSIKKEFRKQVIPLFQNSTQKFYKAK